MKPSQPRPSWTKLRELRAPQARRCGAPSVAAVLAWPRGSHGEPKWLESERPRKKDRRTIAGETQARWPRSLTAIDASTRVPKMHLCSRRFASPVELTAAECDELRRDLQALAVELGDMIEGTRQAARPVELDQPAVGRVSRIDAIQQQKMLEANRNAQRSRIQLVRSALSRFDDGEYGDCPGCGECVGYARLKARPESVFCIDCQSSRERG